MKSFIKKIIISVFILISLNYFFAHFAFNQVLTQFIETTMPKGSTISFSSYFSFFPSTSVNVNDIDYQDSKDMKLQISHLNAKFKLSNILTKKQLEILDLKLDFMRLNLKSGRIDELLKTIIFQLIREGLGVPTTSKIEPIKHFSINNLQLERVNYNETEIFKLSNLVYDSNNINYMNFCFSSPSNAQKFYQRFIAQYLIAAKVKGDCITFTKIGGK